MDRELPDDNTIETAIALAVRAPSVHNTQPWRWRIGDRSVHLYADPGLHLPRTDPDRRDLILSCGTALHHLRVALAALGWQTQVHRLPNPADPDHIASVELQRHDPTEDDIALAAAIPRRRTDRRHFSSWPVPTGYVTLMATRAAEVGVVLRRTEALFHLEHVVAEAARNHANDPDYLTELAAWSGRHGSPDGVPAGSAPVPDTGPGGLPARAFAGPRLAQPVGSSADDDAEVLLVLGTTSDDVMSWLRAGEATSAVLLTATSLGLASCPLTEPLEIRETRDAVRNDVLGDRGFPQMVLRVGWAPINADPLPATPRHSVPEFTEALDGSRRAGAVARH